MNINLKFAIKKMNFKERNKENDYYLKKLELIF